MKKTGEFLRKAREDRGLSVHEIGLSLKINPKILKQIEDGDKNSLPAKTFLRGFVQSYALFLKIDPNEVLKIFSDEMGTTKPNQISLTSGPQIKGSSIGIDDPENKDDLGIKRHTGQNFSEEKFEFKNIGIGIVVFILLLSLIAVRKIVEKYQKEAEVDLAKTEENLKSSNKLELPQAPAASTPVPAADSKISVPPQVTAPSANSPTAPAPEIKPPSTTTAGVPQPATPNELSKPIHKTPPPAPNPATTSPTNSPGSTTALPSQNPGLPVNKPTPPSIANPTVTPVPKPTTTGSLPAVTNPNKPAATGEDAKKPVAAPPAATTAAASPSIPVVPKEEPKKPKNIELVIEAFETVEIEMTQSTGKVEKIKMSPSQIQTFKTVSGVKLNISNGGAVNLIVNGKDMGVPGDLGKPKRVSF